MPQLVAVAIAGAAVYAGLKWFARTLERHALEARRQADEMQRRTTEAARVPKDLGALEYDAEAQVYRPAGSRRS
jgi:hypothetical protein